VQNKQLSHLGSTRSSLKSDHLLQTPDTFVRTPLPGAEGVEFVVHIAPQRGAAFTQMTAEFATGGVLGPAPAQRFVYVIDGELHLKLADSEQVLARGGYAYLPAGTAHTIRASEAARAAVIEKLYEPPDTTGTAAAAVNIGNEVDVNTMTYDPGASLSMVEVHVMEHGLLMLEGGGIYRLGDSWYPVEAGDFIWMAPYCPQWFGALGKRPAKYLIYKDWRRHPLGA